MTTRDPKIPLVLIALCPGAGVYSSIRLLAPPDSAATLAGRGDLDLNLTVDGKSSNSLKINIR